MTVPSSGKVAVDMLRRRTSSSSSRGTATATALLMGLPVLVWFRDNYFGLCRVHGSSMEPTLFDGDVVLVRKADRGVLLETAVNFLDQLRHHGHPPSSDEVSERARLRRYERQGFNDNDPNHLSSSQPVAKLDERPPLALTGHVVVYQSPMTMSRQYNIKRVIGLGGQLVEVPVVSSSSLSARNQDGKPMSASQHQEPLDTTYLVPPYSLHVEGDNDKNSLDSRDVAHGPISKNLLLGIVEYVVWPPASFGRRVERRPEAALNDKGQRRAFWFEKI